MSTWPIWPALIIAGALLQALSLLPTLRERALRSVLIAIGGAFVLLAAGREHDHLTLVSQLAVWVWLWRGVVRTEAARNGLLRKGFLRRKA